MKECGSLVKTVRDKWVVAANNNDHEETSTEAPPAVFDSIVRRQEEEEQQQEQEKQEKQPERRHEEAKTNPWREVTLMGIARFDYDGDSAKKLLSFRRGDGIIITGEAREWYRGRLLGTSQVGILPSTYVESLTHEETLIKLRDASEKLISLRLERDKALMVCLEQKAKIAKATQALKQFATERKELESRVMELQVEMQIWQAKSLEEEDESALVKENTTLKARIAELESKLAAAPPPPPLPPKPAVVVQEALGDSDNDSSEIDGGAFNTLLNELDQSIDGKLIKSIGHDYDSERPSVPLFGSPLSAICQMDNAPVPILVERLCERLLKNNAKGVRTPGIFRLSASKSELDDAKAELSQGLWRCNLDKLDDILVADLLKTFLRELGEPLLTHDLFPRWVLASKIKSRAVQVPYVRSLMACLPAENISLIEFICNFLVIAISYEEESKLTLGNAALLFAPMFLEYNVLDKKKTEFSSFQHIKKTGFTPLFSRRKTIHGPEAVAALQAGAEDLKALMTVGVSVLQMLLVNFRDIWARFHQTARPFVLYRATKDSGPPKSADELEFKKGNIIGVFQKLDAVYALGEVGGKIGRFQLSLAKMLEIDAE